MTAGQPQRGLHGFTLTDTVVSLAVGMVLILIISVVLVDSQKAFTSAYGGTFGSVIEEGLTARAIFRKTLRQACSAPGTVAVAPNGSWIEVQYYSSPDQPVPDRLARFERSGPDLRLHRSALATGQTLSLETVCRNVTSLEFNLVGGAAEMFLTLDDGAFTQTVHACAVMRSP